VEKELLEWLPETSILYCIDFTTRPWQKNKQKVRRLNDGKSTHGTPELGIVAFGYQRPFGIRAKNFPHGVEGVDELLGVGAVDPVLGRFAHGDDENVAIVPVDGEVGLVDDGFGHVGYLVIDGFHSGLLKRDFDGNIMV
jgi:hypothetical protein